jgi:hypothetical protein
LDVPIILAFLKHIEQEHGNTALSHSCWSACSRRASFRATMARVQKLDRRPAKRNTCLGKASLTFPTRGAMDISVGGVEALLKERSWCVTHLELRACKKVGDDRFPTVASQGIFADGILALRATATSE